MARSQTNSQKATRQHTKHHNARLVLKTIYDVGDVSRADLARITGLTRATVSNIVAGYLDKGIVGETGYGPSLGGKPPIMLSMVADARQLICLDLGNEQFTGAVVNLRGHFEKQISLPVNGRTATAALDLVYELVDQLLTHVTAPVLGIALGSPGLIDADAGLVKQSVNLDWRDLPLQQLLADRFQFPVHIANDSHLAALAEYSYGDDDTSNLVLIKMGQGLARVKLGTSAWWPMATCAAAAIMAAWKPWLASAPCCARPKPLPMKIPTRCWLSYGRLTTRSPGPSYSKRANKGMPQRKPSSSRQGSCWDWQ